MYICTIVLCVINSATAISAVLGNGAVIAAIWKTASLRSPTIVLLCSLAVTDLLSGLLTQPMFVTELIARNISRNYKLFCAISKYKLVLGYVLCCASFLTLTGIAIERLLALCLHLRYKALVTLPKVLAAVTYIWIQSVSATAFCFIIEFRSFLYGVVVSSLLNMAINIVVCVCVLQIVRKHERRIESEAILSAHLHDRRRVDNKSFKRASVTMVGILSSYFLCYTPFLSVVLLISKTSRDSNVATAGEKLAYDIAGTIILVFSSFNPCFYCLRITELRQAVVNLIFRRPDQPTSRTTTSTGN